MLCATAVDIAATLWNVRNQWSEVEDFLASWGSGYSLGSCIETRWDDLTVSCGNPSDEFDYTRSSNLLSISESAILDEMQGVDRPNRRACLAMYIAYEISNYGCYRNNINSCNIGQGFFNWWKEEFAVSSDWEPVDCPASTNRFCYCCSGLCPVSKSFC